MSYGGYQQGYGQSNPYAQQDRYNGGYNQGGYAEQGYGTPPNMEMQPLNNGYSDGSSQGRPQQSILDTCSEITFSIRSLEGELQQHKIKQDRYLNSAGDSGTALRDLQNDADRIMQSYRNLTERVKKVKSSPQSLDPRYAPQVGKIDRELKAAINKFQQLDSEFRKKARDQTIRQLRIVRPDATEQELVEAAEDTQGQVFQQALMNADRRGQASSALRAVQERHEAIQKIERTMIELAQLFQDLNEVVVQQEALVENIEQKGEETYTNVVAANTELTGGIEKARSRNKKKWICLGICVLIILIIVIAVVAYIFANKKN